MKALIMTEYRGALEVGTWPDPACPEDGVVLQLDACGVCRSDHHAWAGVDPDVSLPHVMGHEFAGTVVAAGPGTSVKVGARVTAPFILSCGTCPDCTAGRGTVCATQHCVGFSGPGAFAEYLPVPHADFNVVPLPDVIPMEIAAAMGCRVTTAWRALVDRAGLQPAEWVAVHGCGGVGLSVIAIARALGARVIGVDPSENARRLARDMGADMIIDPADSAEVIRQHTGGGADVSVDALGITATFEASLRCLRKLGRHVQVGMPVGQHVTVPLPLLELVYARQLTIHGMRGLDAAGFAPLVDLIAAGRLDLAPMVTSRIGLGEVEATLRAMDGRPSAGVAIVTTFA
ncbi:MAG: zinc-binding dehydrogenase [Shimia sp.]